MHTRGLDQSGIRSVALIELTQLGDVLVMIPALRSLRARYPAATFHLFVSAKYAHLLRASSINDDRTMIHAVELPDRPMPFLDAVRTLRRLGVDLAFSMSPPKRNAALALASGAKAKVGYLTYRNTIAPYLHTTEIESFGCTVSARESYGRENIESRALKICRAVGAPVHNGKAEGLLKEEALLAARERLARIGLPPNRLYVAIQPFARWEYRTWPLERFAEVAVSALSGSGRDIVFLCDAMESSLVDPARTRFAGDQRVHFFSSNDLVETAALIRSASVVVCNDSGPLHLAAALGTPVVGLYGPASPALTGPRTDKGTWLFHEVECSPCDQLRCVRPDRRCIDLITVEEVFRAVSGVLGQKLSPRMEAHA